MGFEDYATIHAGENQDVAVARLKAEPKLCNQLVEICQSVQQDCRWAVMLDFKNVDFFSDESAKHLLGLLKALKDAGGELKMFNVAAPTRTILDSMGLVDLIPIVEGERG